jgi:hypothetical protein
MLGFPEKLASQPCLLKITSCLCNEKSISRTDILEFIVLLLIVISHIITKLRKKKEKKRDDAWFQTSRDISNIDLLKQNMFKT